MGNNLQYSDHSYLIPNLWFSYTYIASVVQWLLDSNQI
jgi:hypothetical protein